MPRSISVLYWSHDEQRVCVRLDGKPVWKTVRYDDDGYGWIVVAGVEFCVFS